MLTTCACLAADIFEATRDGDLATVQSIVSQDANAVLQKNERSWTALHWAASSGHLNVARFLVEKKADINAMTDNGLTPLDWSELEGRSNVSDYLRTQGGMHGADIKSYTSGSNTKATTPVEDQDQKAKEAIDIVVGQFNHAWIEFSNSAAEIKRNPLKACLTSAVSDAFEKYGDDLRKIDISACPTDFRIAFVKFYQALHEAQKYSDSVTGLRGVLKGFVNGFGALVNLQANTANAVDPLEKAGNEFVLVCVKYGVNVK